VRGAGVVRLRAMFSSGLFGAALSALLLYARVANAQTSEVLDKLSAEVLFDDALKRMESKDYATACPKLEESQRLDPGIGTLLYLAECYRSIGHNASAWMTFRSAAFAAKAAGQADREAAALELARQLESQLLRAKLMMPAKLPRGTHVLFDGHPLSNEVLGTELPIDPGSHDLEMTAPGMQPWSFRFSVNPKRAVTEVPLPALQPLAPNRERPLGPTAADTLSRNHTGWFLTFAGAALVGTAAGLYLSGEELVPTPALLGGAGGVAMIGGLYLTLSSPPSSGHASAGPVGVTLSGKF
jgi:tellurite resistance protein